MSENGKPTDADAHRLALEAIATLAHIKKIAADANADGLDFIVLDELHTYRGRQGADVAMLIRRLRDRLSRDRDPICIGTSAKMANSGSEEDKTEAVAKVASRLFGQTINPDAVIVENLARATNTARKPATLLASISFIVFLRQNSLERYPN